MVPRPTGCQMGAMTADFASQIRLALENLHDFAALQKLALTSVLSDSGESLDQSVRRLRTELLQAIERLNPAGDLSPRARERRPYTLLYGRYVQGLSTAELVEQTAISVRQLRREHKRALDAVAHLMWDRLSALGLIGMDQSTQHVSVPLSSQGLADDEAQQLIRRARPEYLPLSPVVAGVLALVTPVAGVRGIRLHSQLPDPLPTVQASRVVLRQALMEILSCAMERVAGGEITIAGMAEQAFLQISATGQIRAAGSLAQGRLEVSRRLVESQGGQLTVREGMDWWEARIDLPVAKDVPILMIDDNQSLVELFRRYLAGSHYQIVAAATADEAIQRAREVKPRLVILDVMVPHQDGWEILQCLRSAPEMHDTPVVICSVLNEPEIAASLGASGYLTKPVTQDALLTMVERHCRPLP